MRPKIIVSQGKDANKIMGNLLGFEGVEDSLPTSIIVTIGEDRSLWLPMVHPARHINDIRKNWSSYTDVIKYWLVENPEDRTASSPSE